MRIDLGFGVSSLQGELKCATVDSLVRGNALVRRAKAIKDFKLTFVPIDFRKGGILVVTDAALGNVMESGVMGSDPKVKVASRAGYLVLLADEALMKGHRGRFDVLDFRSHRLTRVCRSSCACEAYGLEEGVDAADVVRGQLAEVRGVVGDNSRTSRRVLETVPLVAVVDARDAHDRVRSDVAPTSGAQKSLAVTVAALRQVFRSPASSVRWTHTENMLPDALTKAMDASHLIAALASSVCSLYTAEI